MAVELPPDLIRTHIFSLLLAVDIRRCRVLGENWNLAYLQDVGAQNALSETQPTRGGSKPVGYLFSTDRDQGNATRGTGTLRSFMRLSDAFPGRNAKIVATSYGLSCIYLKDPVEFIVTNSLDNISMNLNIHLPEEEYNCVGMAVFPMEGVQVPEYMVVIPYRPDYLNHDADGIPRIRFLVWGSDQRDWDNILYAQQWLNHTQVLVLESWNPRNIIQIGAAIYFHLSENDLVRFDLDEGGPEIMDLPVQLLGAEQKALCVWRGQPSFMILQATNVQIYSLQEDLRNLVHNIVLEDYIEADRWVFRSLSLKLRSKPVETPTQVMAGASVVGYAEPNWLLLRQRDGFVLINLDPVMNKTRKGRPRRINPKDARGNFFLTYCSSLIRVAG